MSPRLAGRARALFLALFCALSWATAPVSALQDTTGREGPLQNDAFLPTSRAAATLLARGDAELAQLGPPAQLELQDARSRRLASNALESWFEALRDAPPNTRVPFDPTGLVSEERVQWLDPGATGGRRTEALELSVLRRLAQTAPALRALWRERVAPEAQSALRLAGRDAPRLAAVESHFPATRAAALAALRRAELALESGRPRIAEGWLERAERHALLAGAEELPAALARRRAALASIAPRAARASAPVWSRAPRLELINSVPLRGPRLRVLGRPTAASGLVALDDGRLALQVEGTVWLVEENGNQRSFEPAQAAKALALQAPIMTAGRDPGWATLPATDGRDLYLVEGRAGARLEFRRDPFGRKREEIWQSNMLLAIRPPAEVDEVPKVLWALGPTEWLGRGGARRPMDEVLEAGMWEFQPGPLVAGSLLLVQARRFALDEPEASELPEPIARGEAHGYLLALDRATGAVVWKSFLGRGTDLVPELGLRFSYRELVRTPAMPAVSAGALVFVPTSLGMGFLVEICDGRLVWSFLNRRRDPRTPGWGGHRAPPLVPGEPAVALWAPVDSDFLYAMRLSVELEGRGPLALPPLEIGEAEELVGGDLERLFVVGRAGARRTLSAWEPATGRRFDSVYFGRGERPTMGGLIVGPRAAVATDRGLYFFDLERELYLLQHLAFDLPPEQPSGGLYALPAGLMLLGGGGLRRFDVPPADGRDR